MIVQSPHELKMVKPSFFLQRLILTLPYKLRRMSIARALSRLSRSHGNHFLKFQSGYLAGHISEGQIAHSLVSRYFEDYGFFNLANHLLSGGGIYFDVGANFGFHSFGLEGFEKSGYDFHMFEPNPVCCRCIRYSLDAYKLDGRYLVASAIGDAPSQAFLQFNEGKNVQGWLATFSEGEISKGYSVSVQTLDEYCSNKSIRRVNLLKMDIEGSEWHALCGADNLFKQASVDFCYFEVNQIALARRGVTLNSLFSFFLDNGYVLCWPHVEINWIKPRLLPCSEMQTLSYTCEDRTKLNFTKFEPNSLSCQNDHQFDLLAVSPKMRLVHSSIQ